MGDALPGGARFLHSANSANTFSLYTTDASGANREDVHSATGYAYGVSLSPDRSRVAYHITNTPGRPGYEIYVVDLRTKNAKLIASDYKYIHFAPLWSPDGKWLLYQRCAHLEDPGHDRSDLCIARADGSEQRVLTTGQSHWFAAAIGTPQRHSSGSNVPAWSPDGRRIACTLLLPGSRTAWPYQSNRPDTDHFNRDYHPEEARGGTRICLIDPKTGKITPITHDEPPTWNFRLSWSPDGTRLAFMRAAVGSVPELCVMDVRGGKPRFLTRGLNGTGADHVRWVRLAVPSL
jgi:TolB protein